MGYPESETDILHENLKKMMKIYLVQSNYMKKTNHKRWHITYPQHVDIESEEKIQQELKEMQLSKEESDSD